MARSDLLLTLVRAGLTGDRGTLRTAAEALAAEERANKHTVFADKLSRIIDANHRFLSSALRIGGGPSNSMKYASDPGASSSESMFWTPAK